MTRRARPSRGCQERSNSPTSTRVSKTCSPRVKTAKERSKGRPSLASQREALLSMQLETLTRLCEAVDTPRSLAVYLLAKHGEWAQYLELSFPDPSLESFADDYLVTEVMSKNPLLPLNTDRAAVAKEKFLQSELLCEETNARFRSYFERPLESTGELHIIFDVQRIISSALGPLSKSDLDLVESEFRFGPGATSAVHGSDVLLSRKYTSRKDVTPRLSPFASCLLPEVGGGLALVCESTVTTVPKNAKTDRTICIEPHLNVFYQLGVGRLIRRKLRRLGLAPDDQGRNREMARTAAMRGYATIDLSMASDTIASQVVLALLPEQWFHLLHLGRTDSTLLDGHKIVLEKFSSMGNGFTWELESLIFYAIARSLTDEPIGVFGDDLVVPVDIVARLCELLNFFGFKVNERKSHWQGDFRESCGTDWWRGIDVRPIYFRSELDVSRPIWHYAISMANAVRLYSHRRGDRVFCDHRFKRAWFYLKRRSADGGRTFLSAGYGDDGLIENLDEACPSRLTDGLQGYRAVIQARKPVQSRRTDELGAYLAALHRGTPTTASRLIEYCRGRLGRPRTEVVPVFHWYDLGPWA